MEYAKYSPVMDHPSNAINQGFGGAALGAEMSQAKARTIASAVSRIDALNERLLKVCESMSMISSQLGALTPVSGLLNNSKNGQTVAAGGAVHRLNDAADDAHAKISELETYIQSIGRALG